MNTRMAWILAIVAVAVGAWLYGWQGAIFGFTIAAFGMLLQFSRALRIMRAAARVPVGHVMNTTQLAARLKAGMALVQVIQLTGSLGEALSDQPEVWAWRDPGGTAIRVTLVGGRVTEWNVVPAGE